MIVEISHFYVLCFHERETSSKYFILTHSISVPKIFAISNSMTKKEEQWIVFLFLQSLGFNFKRSSKPMYKDPNENTINVLATHTKIETLF